MNWGPLSKGDVLGEPMQSDYVLNDQLGSGLSRGKSDQSHQVHGLGKKRSMMVRMVSLPWDSESPVMKSRPMCVHGREGTNRGHSLPGVGVFVGLVTQACTYIFRHFGQPEGSSKEFKRMFDSWVSSNYGGVGPVQDQQFRGM